MTPITNTALARSRFDFLEAIQALRVSRKAILLAHYYQDAEIQDLADAVEDSLGLARLAQKTTADVIVFIGVHFMAETAKILNPNKIVVIPDMNAGCSLAESCPPDAFGRFKAENPNHFVVSYINCSAEIKAMSDVICTSSNAAKIIDQIPKNRPIIFAPDRNLGRYLIKQTGRDMLLWDGSCMVHDIFSEKRLVQLKLQHPEAKVIAHPECEEKILKHADFVGSTSKLLDFAASDSSQSFIVITESGILHQMQKRVPEKTFIPGPTDDSTCACNQCPHMRLNTVEKIYYALRDLEPRIEMPEDLRKAAERPLQRMLEWS